MEVKLRLDPKLVWRLEDDAEKGGQSFNEYVNDLLTLKCPAPKLTTPRQVQIVRLHEQGFTDQEIAAQLECVREYVVQIRRRHGLKPNRKRVSV